VDYYMDHISIFPEKDPVGRCPRKSLRTAEGVPTEGTPVLKLPYLAV
jgi:hypothetical protein